MTDLPNAVRKQTPSAGGDRSAPSSIDRDHLSRMTFGDGCLAREVLDLFERQAGMLIARMHGAETGVVAALAHTLKGSAQGIGATGVERAAAMVEAAARRHTTAAGRPEAAAAAEPDLAAAVSGLETAVAEARDDIARLLRAT